MDTRSRFGSPEPEPHMRIAFFQASPSGPGCDTRYKLMFSALFGTRGGVVMWHMASFEDLRVPRYVSTGRFLPCGRASLKPGGAPSGAPRVKRSESARSVRCSARSVLEQFSTLASLIGEARLRASFCASSAQAAAASTKESEYCSVACFCCLPNKLPPNPRSCVWCPYQQEDVAPMKRAATDLFVAVVGQQAPPTAHVLHSMIRAFAHGTFVTVDRPCACI